MVTEKIYIRPIGRFKSYFGFIGSDEFMCLGIKNMYPRIKNNRKINCLLTLSNGVFTAIILVFLASLLSTSVFALISSKDPNSLNATKLILGIPEGNFFNSFNATQYYSVPRPPPRGNASLPIADYPTDLCDRTPYFINLTESSFEHYPKLNEFGKMFYAYESFHKGNALNLQGRYLEAYSLV